jgi:hypothetical protein
MMSSPRPCSDSLSGSPKASDGCGQRWPRVRVAYVHAQSAGVLAQPDLALAVGVHQGVGDQFGDGQFEIGCRRFPIPRPCLRPQETADVADRTKVVYA